MVTDINVKQFDSSMETHKVYLEILNICSISHSVYVNAIFEFFPCSSTLATPCEIALEALKETVALDVVIPGPYM